MSSVFFHTENVSDFSQVEEVVFALYGNKDMKDYSVIKDDPRGLTNPTIKDRNVPAVGGPADLRLGAVEKKELCITCRGDESTCQGHFGHITLVEPLFHFPWLNHGIKNILPIFCLKCHEPLPSKKDLRQLRSIKNPRLKFATAKLKAKSVPVCRKCAVPAHGVKIKKDSMRLLLIAESKKKTVVQDEDVSHNFVKTKKKVDPRTMTTTRVQDILTAVNVYRDLLGLKFDLSDLVMNYLPVPPMQIRPSSYFDQSQTPNNDSITYDLSAIIKLVETMRKIKSGDGDLKRNNYMALTNSILQLKWSNYFNNDASMNKSVQKNGAQSKNINERLRGKDGRIRNNVVAKRVDYCARSVISGNGSINLNEVAIPLLVAKKITKPEIVNDKNIDRLRAALMNGPNNYPGANSIVIREYIDGSERLESWNFFDNPHFAEKKAKRLDYGQIVYRHMLDGDQIILDRQPSLHKYSIMGHKIKVITDDPTSLTIQINVNVTAPYGADFDGDEMNIFDIQGILAETEARLLMDVSNHFISIAKSTVIITAIHHTISGLYMMSMDQVKIDWAFVQDMLAATNLLGKVHVQKGKLYTGKEAFSLVLPPKINVKRGSFEIKNSQLISGLITKSIISAIVENCLYIHGKEETLNLFGNMQRYCIAFLARYGTTIGIDDLMFPQKIMKSAHQMTETRLREIMHDINKYENDPSIYGSENHEDELLNSLKNIKNPSEKMLMETLNPTLGVAILINSGASGDSMNLYQMAEKLGQTIFNQKRLPLKYNNRTLPGFAQHDARPECRGYCKQSFVSGLNPEQFFFHLMTGREGTIQTNIKTSETGYIQRRLVKIMEDVKMDYIDSVRHEGGKIIQHVYGDNGGDPTRQYKYTFETLKMNNKEILENCLYTSKEISGFAKDSQSKGKGADASEALYTEKINESILKKMCKYRNDLRVAQMMYGNDISEFRQAFWIPVNLSVLITTILNERDLVATAKTDSDKKVKTKSKSEDDRLVTPSDVVRGIKKMYSENLIIYHDAKGSLWDKAKGSTGNIDDESENPNPNLMRIVDDDLAKSMLKYYLFDALSPRKCTHQYKFTSSEWNSIIDHFNYHMDLSRIQPGEMVGVIASHSISEPLTQLGLKSFQKAGTGTRSNNAGVAVVKEVTEVKEKTAGPMHRLVLKPQYEKDKKIAEAVAGYLTFTKFGDLIQDESLIYDPEILRMPKTDDVGGVDANDKVEPMIMNDNGSLGDLESIKDCHWIYEIKLSKKEMLKRGLLIMDLILEFYKNQTGRVSQEGKKKSKKNTKKILDTIIKCVVVANYDNNEEPTLHIRFRAFDYNDTTLTMFTEIIKETYHVKGINKIKSAYAHLEKDIPYFDPKTGDFTKQDRYVVYTDGVNIRQVSKLKHVDMTRSYCNHIPEVYNNYGIEVARLAYIKELLSAFENVDVSINYQHIEILADTVTYSGIIIPATRHGTKKMDVDPLPKMTFEKIVEEAIFAAMFGETDHVRSAAGRNMFGRQIKAGTGNFKLSLNLDMVIALANDVKQTGHSLKEKEILSSLKSAAKSKFNIMKSVMREINKSTTEPTPSGKGAKTLSTRMNKK